MRNSSEVITRPFPLKRSWRFSPPLLLKMLVLRQAEMIQYFDDSRPFCGPFTLGECLFSRARDPLVPPDLAHSLQSWHQCCLAIKLVGVGRSSLREYFKRSNHG
jgi:hypothetical protein